MDTKLIDKIMKVLILLCLIVLFVELSYFKLDNCDKCELKIDNKNYVTSDFLKIYSDKCFKSDFILNNNLSGLFNSSHSSK